MGGGTQAKRCGSAAALAGMMTVAIGLCGAQTVPSPGVTIAARNVTMASDGTGGIPFTLTSTNKFAGRVMVVCAAPTPGPGVREPSCIVGIPAVASNLTLAADGTATGEATVSANAPLPSAAVARLSSPRQRNHEGGGAILALAGALMVGWGLRRKTRRLGSQALGVAGLLVVLTGLAACGGPATLTPGTYTYTLTATSAGGTTGSTVAGSEVTASTTVVVTVPPGIVVNYNVASPG